MKKMWIAVLALSLLLCWQPARAKQAEAPAGRMNSGVSMPTNPERWVNDGNSMKMELDKLGYGTDLQYAEDVIENQVSQIENMITKGVKALVVAPIDGESLTDVLQKAADAKIPVIAYDRLIKKTENITYYATFDTQGWRAAGRIHGRKACGGRQRAVQHRAVRRVSG